MEEVWKIIEKNAVEKFGERVECRLKECRS